MSTAQYTLYKKENVKDSIYLKLSDVKETCVEIWEQEGVKKTFVQVKIPLKEWEKIISNYVTNKESGAINNEINI